MRKQILVALLSAVIAGFCCQTASAQLPGLVVPVTILDEQDGPWNKNAWKTEAFYGNPPAGFTPAP